MYTFTSATIAFYGTDSSMPVQSSTSINFNAECTQHLTGQKSKKVTTNESDKGWSLSRFTPGYCQAEISRMTLEELLKLSDDLRNCCAESPACLKGCSSCFSGNSKVASVTPFTTSVCVCESKLDTYVRQKHGLRYCENSLIYLL